MNWESWGNWLDFIAELYIRVKVVGIVLALRLPSDYYSVFLWLKTWERCSTRSARDKSNCCIYLPYSFTFPRMLNYIQKLSKHRRLAVYRVRRQFDPSCLKLTTCLIFKRLLICRYFILLRFVDRLQPEIHQRTNFLPKYFECGIVFSTQFLY